MVECCYALSFMLTVVYTVCRKLTLYAGHHYAECRYECHGASTNALAYQRVFIESEKRFYKILARTLSNF